MLGFIAISTTGMLYDNSNIKVNDILKKLNTNNDRYTRYVDATDLPVAILTGTTSTLNMYHFNSYSQRIIGQRCFEQYSLIFN